VNYAGRTSMEVGVLCMGEDARTGVRRHTASAYFTFVALDDDGRPAQVAPIRPDSPVEMRRFEAARLRRESRLASRKDQSIRE
jgi:acyl-CoA hydrolase